MVQMMNEVRCSYYRPGTFSRSPTQPPDDNHVKRQFKQWYVILTILTISTVLHVTSIISSTILVQNPFINLN